MAFFFCSIIIGITPIIIKTIRIIMGYSGAAGVGVELIVSVSLGLGWGVGVAEAVGVAVGDDEGEVDETGTAPKSHNN